jgi:fructokinase
MTTKPDNTPYVVGLGEALWDVLPEGKKLGGAPANFAFHAAQFGRRAIAVSAVGEDNLGNETLEEFKKKDLNVLMPRVPYATGTVQVTVDEQGIPTYDIKENVAWDNIPFTPEIEAIAKNCEAVCWGSLAQRNVVSRQTIQKFLDAMPSDGNRLRIFDINLRQNFYTPEVIQDSMQRCNILKINDEELVTVSRLFGYPGLDIRNKCWLLLGKYDLKMLVLTCGVNGSYVFTPGHVSFQPTPKVDVADTVGAGDSFTGSFCASILRGRSVAEAHEIAVRVSAYVCTQKGAMPQLPEELTR